MRLNQVSPFPPLLSDRAARNDTKDFFPFSHAWGLCTAPFYARYRLKCCASGGSCSSLPRVVLSCFLRARSPVSSLGSGSLQVGASEGRSSQAGILQVVACCVRNKRALQRAELLLAATTSKQADCMHAACALILLVPLLCLALFFF